MKKTALFMLLLIFAATLLYAQSEEQVKSGVGLNAGLTKKPIAGFTVVTAEDAQVTTDGKTTYVEDLYTYTGRKFKAVEDRLKKIEAAAEELKNRVTSIEKHMADAEKAVKTSP
ncbi:MAG: hypothetical protein NT036_03405 [Candidatus Omnitrophica bacterium]|nr:hypothetical protein [Candidatus Omnitrophota bacterium]